MRHKKPHTITALGLCDWLEKETLLFARSEYERKRLEVTMRGEILVFHGYQGVYRGFDPLIAVEVYNDITGEWIDPDAEKLKNFTL